MCHQKYSNLFISIHLLWCTKIVRQPQEQGFKISRAAQHYVCVWDNVTPSLTFVLVICKWNSCLSGCCLSVHRRARATAIDVRGVTHVLV